MRETSINLHHLREETGRETTMNGIGIGIGIALRGAQGVTMNETGTGNRTRLLREGTETNTPRLHLREDIEITMKGTEIVIVTTGEGEEGRVRGVTDTGMRRKRRRIRAEEDLGETEITGIEDQLVRLLDTTRYLPELPRQRTVMPHPFPRRMQFPVLLHLSLPTPRPIRQQRQKKRRNDSNEKSSKRGRRRKQKRLQTQQRLRFPALLSLLLLKPLPRLPQLPLLYPRKSNRHPSRLRTFPVSLRNQ